MHIRSTRDDRPGETRGGRSQSVDVAVITLATLAVIYTLHAAASLFIPLVVASLVSLLFNPLINLMGRAYVPRSMSALLLLLVIGGPFTLLGAQLAEPAQRWIQQVPELAATISEQIEDLSVALVAPEPETSPPVTKRADPSPWRSFLSWAGLEGETPEPEPPAE
ncbi:MAG: AI-2E family transporter, partial [Halioglobus sp.]|nr:AI-2E family transporter [Halioglobus sp.]